MFRADTVVFLTNGLTAASTREISLPYSGRVWVRCASPGCLAGEILAVDMAGRRTAELGRRLVAAKWRDLSGIEPVVCERGAD